MILPTFVAISREVIAVVPQDLMEASLSLGATRWQMIREVVLPTAKIGLFGATFLALARATGETVAVALVAGSVANAQFHLLYPGTSIAAWIATEFGESQGNEISALMALGVFLMLLNVCLALISRALVNRQRKILAVRMSELIELDEPARGEPQSRETRFVESPTACVRGVSLRSRIMVTLCGVALRDRRRSARRADLPVH